MKNLTKKTFIAIEAVVYIAAHNSSTPVRSSDICSYMNVTLRYLEQILQKLVQNNVLKSIRGPNGGYMLARDRRKITLSAIYLAVLPLEHADNGNISKLHEKIIQPIYQDTHGAVEQYLSTISIKQLCEKAKNQNALPSGANQSSDFII